MDCDRGDEFADHNAVWWGMGDIFWVALIREWRMGIGS